MDKLVEAGKKNYVGFELPGRTLGVIGLARSASRWPTWPSRSA
ncbi:MAG: hypothetical protein R2719_09640 [Micropruina sp.]